MSKSTALPLFIITLALFISQGSRAEEVRNYKILVPINAQTVTCNSLGTTLNWPDLQAHTQDQQAGLHDLGVGPCNAQQLIDAAQKNGGFLLAYVQVTLFTRCVSPIDCGAYWAGVCPDPGYFEFQRVEHVYVVFQGFPPSLQFNTDVDGGILSSENVTSCPNIQ